MKTIKPLRLGILHKTFEHERRATLAVTALLYVPTDRRVLLPEAAMWKSLAEELGDGPLDECMPKPRAEALVDGHAYPSPHGARTGCPTRLCIGRIDKTLYAVGDRHWTRLGPSAPAPFERMSLGWKSAFGGVGYEANPVGKGFAPIEIDGQRVHPLPNLENPQEPVTAVSSRPAPASFGAIPVPWPQRFRKAGTYDSQWQRELAPGFARDIDWTFFNMAPDDQQQAAYFAPDEAFTLENMHPEKARIEGRLPNAIARVFITRVGAARDLVEVPMRIDTVRFFPHLERMVVSCRGVIPVAEDDASDVACLLAAVEEPGDPRSLDHYRAVLDARTDKQRAALHGLNDRDLVAPSLMPSGDVARIEDPIAAHEELTRSDGLVAKRQRKQAEQQLATMRAEMVAAGLDPEAHPGTSSAAIPEPPPSPSLEDLPRYVEEQVALAEAEKKKALAEQAEAEKQARELCAQQGIDFDAMVEKGRREAAGPPKTTVESRLDEMEATATLFRNAGTPNVELEAQLASPELRAKLEKLERELRTVYRRFCHHFPAAARLDDVEGKALGEELAASVRRGEPAAERDFTGVSLAGLDLHGADLARAWLEAANLEGANLEGANLEGAVLARANLRGANLVGARLAGANLGEANLEGAKLDGADLAAAVLAKAHLLRASLVGASLAGADLTEAKVASADLSRTKLPGATFLKVDFAGARVIGADFTKCNFIEVSLEGADFSETSLVGASFITVVATKTRFVSANMKNVRFVQESRLDGAVFAGACCVESNFRAASLVGCDFRKAELDRSDLSECQLEGAHFDLATATDALFIGTRLRGATLTGANLMNAILHRAAIEGADFRGANLFRADLARVRGDDATRFDDANMKFARVVERLPPPPADPLAAPRVPE